MQIFIENDLDGQGRKNLRVLCVEHIASSTAMCSLQQISAALDSILMFLDRMFLDLDALLQSDTELDFLKDFKQLEVNFQSDTYFALALHVWIFTVWLASYSSMRVISYAIKLSYSVSYSIICIRTLGCPVYTLLSMEN
jgi:hypothetical protein